MKILLLSDIESDYFWDYFDPEVFADTDFIISAGDLKSSYLSFLTTVAKKRLFYVHGNHDVHYQTKPPLGCESLEDTIVYYKGLRILGLGGSYRYNNGPFQYTEKEMVKRYRKLRLLIQAFQGVDIIVSHAPIYQLGDGEDLPHRGFQIFEQMVRQLQPSYFLYGHQHLNYTGNGQRIRQLENTTLINGYNYHFFEYQPNQVAPLTVGRLSRFWNQIRFFWRYKGSPEMLQYRRYRKDQN